MKSWEMKERILKPEAKAPVYICGEAYSDAQGWVEGALQTADMMLGKYVGIDSLRRVGEPKNRGYFFLTLRLTDSSTHTGASRR